MTVEAVRTQEGLVSLTESLLQELKGTVEQFFLRFDCDRFGQLIDVVQGTKGAVFLSGVGKSGIIAQKIVATLNSSATKAFFLSPQNALHGDIGMVGPEDIVLLFSKSGETSELIELCPAIRNKGARSVAVVTNGISRLARACEMTFVLPELKELCPFDLAPTTSTLAQLIFGDLLAMALMRLKNVTLADFIQNHPAGRIGKRQLVKVRDLMVTGDKMPRCSPNDFLETVLVELSNKQCGCVCVVGGEDKLFGIFTDGDLRRSLQGLGVGALSRPMHELMTKSPKKVAPHMLAYDAMRYMESDQKRPVTVLIVEEEGRCLGLLKMHDILQSGI